MKNKEKKKTAGSIMLVQKEIDVTTPLTSEQKEMIRRASEMPIVYDEDSPEMTDEDLVQFRRASDIRGEE